MTTTFERETLPGAAGENENLAPLERLFAAAEPGAVFSEPVTAGAYTVITAREVRIGGGYGFGGGYGPAPRPDAVGAEHATVAGGRGGGGGGGSTGRPVAAIIIGPNGVKVQPIVDVTKFMLTAIGTAGVVGPVIRQLLARRKS